MFYTFSNACYSCESSSVLTLNVCKSKHYWMVIEKDSKVHRKLHLANNYTLSTDAERCCMCYWFNFQICVR